MYDRCSQEPSHCNGSFENCSLFRLRKKKNKLAIVKTNMLCVIGRLVLVIHNLCAFKALFKTIFSTKQIVIATSLQRYATRIYKYSYLLEKVKTVFI